MIRPLTSAILPTVLLSLIACEPADVATSTIRFKTTGRIEARGLDEISGIQASQRHPGVFWVHNDDGRPWLHAINAQGAHLGRIDIGDAVNADWEDITMIPGREGDLLVIADTGDNRARRSRVWLYIVDEPKPDEAGRFSGAVDYRHRIEMQYPDGPRDTESIAFDPVSQRILLLSKREQPPRLYGLGLQTALQADHVTLEPLGVVNTLRPPTAGDARTLGRDAIGASQPTGMDIAPDGRRAAIITYRSLYLYDLRAGEDWRTAFRQTPVEILGPPHVHEEAVSFLPEGEMLIVTAEGRKAPLYLFDLGADTGEPP